MLTLFCVPRAFEGHIGVIQRNAIRSWRLLWATPWAHGPQLVLLGGEAGVKQMAAETGADWIPEIALDGHGTPLVSDVFHWGQAIARSDLVCYINADIILLPNFAAAVTAIQQQFPGPFLAVGRRLDLYVTEELEFGPGWHEDLMHDCVQRGAWHSIAGIDYFLFRRGCLGDLPPFTLGRWRWDNWIIWRALDLGIPVIDATAGITAIHQNHDYAHHGPEADQQRAGNDALVGSTGGKLCRLTDCTHEMRPSGGIVLKVPQEPL